ncbi:DUF3261 domain-containing protein [Microbulbifer sp. JMSA003]|uniref:DUF3261 domain-containing protein n=1 Tax=Microbulbifer sp. JMSA003 TaxID=3243369 RepID=UPI00403A5A35
MSTGGRKEELQSWPLAPLLSEGPRQLNQHLRIVYQGDEYELMAATFHTMESLKISLLSPEGISLLDVTYDGNEVSTHYHMSRAERVPPEKLLADIQFVYWPIAQLREVLPVGWNLDEAIVEGIYTRKLSHNGEVNSVARYSSKDIWKAQIELEHKLLGYRLSIRNF